MKFKIGRTRARALFELGKGAAIQTVTLIWVLFETDLGEGMPDLVKLGGPVICWILLMLFFFLHCNSEGEVECEIL